VLPKPAQKPHPPVWLAASSPESVERAAAAGFSILMDPHSSHAQIGEKRALYARTLAAHGHSLAGREFPTARMIAVAPTDGEAEAVARAGAEWTIGSYARPPGTPVGPSAAVERYVNDVAIHGFPERVVDEIQALREQIGLDYLMCAPLSHESFMLFTDRVLPKLV
jgi:alkanesulfonate monooxygenase SsuD/methylene tetrahydromethanopterin reductase-like flavin-dependent oxidoreductase (luciferase family)